MVSPVLRFTLSFLASTIKDCSEKQTQKMVTKIHIETESDWHFCLLFALFCFWFLSLFVFHWSYYLIQYIFIIHMFNSIPLLFDNKFIKHKLQTVPFFFRNLPTLNPSNSQDLCLAVKVWCLLMKHSSLIIPLSTHANKRTSENLMLWGNPEMD